MGGKGSGGNRRPKPVLSEEQLAEWDNVQVARGEDYRFKTLDEAVAAVNQYELTDPTRYTVFALAVASIGSGSNDRDPDDLRRRFYAYLQLCAKTKTKIGNLQAYASMGIPSRTAKDWAAGTHGSPEHKKLMQEVTAICSASRENLVQNGQINPVIGIFYGKNFDHLQDQTEHVVTRESGLGELVSGKDIAEKYKNIIED